MTSTKRTEVWDIIPSLSGVAAPERNERLILAIQVYIDDSGTGGETPIFLLAGYEAPAENWARFSDEWRAALDAEPKIEYFKASECYSGTGAFSGISVEDRWTKAMILAHLIKKYAQNAHVFSLKHADFRAVFHGKIDSRYDHPYYFLVLDYV